MKNIVLLLFIISFGCSSSKNVKQAYIDKDIYQTEIANTQLNLIATTLSEFPNHSEMSIAIVNPGKTLFFGLQRKNDSLKTVFNLNQVFEIGSITKVFTTQLLINLLEQGKINSLDELVMPYLDFKIKGNPNITFRQLANHTSGLPGNLDGTIFNTDVSNPYKNWHKEKFIKYFTNEVKLESNPGEKYLYSNVGMALLTYAISRIESEGYEDLLQENIFKPLHMEHSTTQRELIDKYLVQGYNWKGKPTVNWDLAEIKGAGAILSSTKDLSKYLIWNFDALNHQLSLMKKTSKVLDDNLDIALGWHIKKNETTMPFLWHNGGTGGYKSSMAINLSNNSGVIILSNIGATNNPKKWLIDTLCFDLMKSLEK